jgi:hypothetical protein
MLISKRFFGEKRPLSVQQIDRLFSAVGKHARQKCVDVTHLIPCHLMNARDPTELKIGPVTFLNRSGMRHLLLSKRRGHFKSAAKEKEAYSRDLLCRGIRYYRNFRWVAEVEIKGCDAETSATIAEQAVIAALDCLHLLLGAQWTGRMRVGGYDLRSDTRAKLTVSASDQINASLSTSVLGQVNFPDGWSAQLSEPGFKHYLELFAVALETAVNPDLDRPLSRRFLDAAQWFGEASRDESPSTRVVKYVTCLERMVMTENKTDITSFVSERVSALCFDNPESRISWREKAKVAYDLRSKLVHGSISPRAQEVLRGVHIGSELGEVTLLRGLDAFGKEGLRATNMNSERLSRWFDSTVRRTRAAR